MRLANWVSIASDNGVSPIRRQAIIWTNAGLLSIGRLGTNFSENLIKIQNVSFKKMRLNMSSAKWLASQCRHTYKYGKIDLFYCSKSQERKSRVHKYIYCIEGSAQDCGNSNALARELPQFSAKPSVYDCFVSVEYKS